MPGHLVGSTHERWEELERERTMGSQVASAPPKKAKPKRKKKTAARQMKLL
jgi:hypothetical protein